MKRYFASSNPKTCPSKFVHNPPKKNLEEIQTPNPKNIIQKKTSNSLCKGLTQFQPILGRSLPDSYTQQTHHNEERKQTTRGDVVRCAAAAGVYKGHYIKYLVFIQSLYCQCILLLVTYKSVHLNTRQILEFSLNVQCCKCL